MADNKNKVIIWWVEFDLSKQVKYEGIIICNPLAVLVPSWFLSIEIYEEIGTVEIEAKQKWRLIMSNSYPFSSDKEQKELRSMAEELISDIQNALVKLWFTRFDI